MKNATLTVVGSGIKFLSHLTNEAKIYMEQSDKILYLVNEPAMKEWIKNKFPYSESLDTLYVSHHLRSHCYRAIKDYILSHLYQQQRVCVVIYGHPTVFSQPALEAVKQAKQEGYDAIILPGISAEDCLFADLLINPGVSGCQSFEATDFLIHNRKYDPRSHLILWQIGMIGALGHTKMQDDLVGTRLLLNYLSLNYKSNHKVIIYEAAQYPHFNPRIDELELTQLTSATISQISTLYVPPASTAIVDENMINQLGISITDLQ
jgi:uncharacterized protein YabN with tetrapyrrole methylase and pyrophosphatase domain